MPDIKARIAVLEERSAETSMHIKVINEEMGVVRDDVAVIKTDMKWNTNITWAIFGILILDTIAIILKVILGVI
jgi:hypothetical protein